MIKAKVFRNDKDVVYGFEIDNHGQKEVCSAVSALSINTVNAIEAFTDDEFVLDYSNDGGNLLFTVDKLKQGEDAPESELLINTLLLGLRSISNEYKNELQLIDKVVEL